MALIIIKSQFIVCLLDFSKQFEALIPAFHHLEVGFLFCFEYKRLSDRISAKDCESCVEGEEDVISPDKKELSGVEKVK